MRLKNKIALITGAGSGIGRATALLFAREGARMVVADINLPSVEQLAGEISSAGGEALPVKVDVSQTAEVQEMVRQTVDRYGRIDILFNNAGIEFPARVTELRDEDWDYVMAVNLKSIFLCVKYVLKEMIGRGGGVIVNTASQLGLVGYPNFAVYNAAKGGVVNFTRNLALDYVKENIRVNAICPGPIDTPHIHRQLAALPEGERETVRQAICNLVPMGRLGRAEEIAAAVLFLAGEDSSFMTGATLVVDGGYTAQ